MLRRGQQPLGVGLAIAKARRPRTFVVGSSKSTSSKTIATISSKDGTPLPLSSGIRFPGCSVRFYSFRRLDRVCSSYLQSTKKPKKIRVSSSYPNQSEPLHNLFRVCLVEFAVAPSCQVAGLSV